jgi:hypothetical protein
MAFAMGFFFGALGMDGGWEHSSGCFRVVRRVFSNSGLSLERPGIGNTKRVDPLLIGRVYPGG